MNTLDARHVEFCLVPNPGGEVTERYGIRNRRHTDGVLLDPTALVIDRAGRVRYNTAIREGE